MSSVVVLSKSYWESRSCFPFKLVTHNVFLPEVGGLTSSHLRCHGLRCNKCCITLNPVLCNSLVWVDKFVCSALDFHSGKKFCSNATPRLRLVSLELLSRSYLILLMDKLAESDVGDIYVLKKWSKKGSRLPVWPGVWKPRAVKDCWWCRSILLRPFLDSPHAVPSSKNIW